MMEVRDQTVFILGAGASRACGTPLTNEILWHACRNPDVKAELARDVKRLDDLRQVEDCLSEHFHVPAVNARMEEFPSLTLLLSLLDLSIERNRPFGASKAFPNGLSREDLAKARSSIEYIIFAVLDYFLQRPSGTGQRDLLRSGLIDPKVGPQVISLNYDIIADTTMCRIAQERLGDPGRIDYTCDIRTEPYAKRSAIYGKLLKLHGSLNWLFCPGCQALQVGMSANGESIADSSMLKALYEYKPLDVHYICSKTGCRACQCVYCETPLRPVMITPSFVKDYRNPHIQRVWYEAERLLRCCRQAYIVGYSLPDDDLEVIHLLRRGLEGLPGKQIIVVTSGENEAMRRRYISLFGPDIVWETCGLETWMKAIQAGGTAAATELAARA